MRAVCGRLKSDYSYSNTIVYNNFPWPVVTEKNREQIEKYIKIKNPKPYLISKFIIFTDYKKTNMKILQIL